MSPTRFANSVHNAASGYWSIAVGSMQASSVLSAYDASFTAALLDALAQIAVDRQPLLLVAYDTEYPPPLHAKRPIPDAFGVALVLAAARSEKTIARIDAALGEEAEERLADGGLEALRTAIPAARSLPLLRALANPKPSRAVIDYLDTLRLRVEVLPCA